MEPELAVPAEASKLTIQELPHPIIETPAVQSEVPAISKPMNHHISPPSANNTQSILEARCKRFGIPFKPVNISKHEDVVMIEMNEY